MRLVSVNVGLPRDVQWRGRSIRTSIWKAPVAGRVGVRALNLDGDEQSDPSVHGGVDKAVYAYPSEHYAFWREQLAGEPLPWGAFGENLTTQGLSEDSVCIGDHVRCGTVELRVTQPRTPCFKLGIRFDRADMVKRFQASGRSGFYFAVVREGEVGAGDPIELLPVDGDRMSVAEIAQLHSAQRADRAMLRRASGLAALPRGWREHFRSRLEVAGA